MKRIIALALSLVLGVCSVHAAEKVKLSSPDSRLVIEMSVASGQLSYSIRYDGSTIVNPSALALDFADGCFGAGLRIVSNKVTAVHDSYDLPVGKTSHVESDSRQAVIRLEEKAGLRRKLDLVVRAFNDAVAFRYEVPEQEGMKEFALKGERMDLDFVSDADATVLPFKDFHNSHEGNYLKLPVSQLPTDAIFDLPATFALPAAKAGKGPVFVAFTEANMRNYAGMYLRRSGDDLSTVLSPRLDRPEFCVIASLPHRTPWRVFQVSDRIGALIESNVLTTLCDPCVIEDTSWLKPGKTTFSWWCDNHIPDVNFQPGNNFKTNKYYIDFAAASGIEYHSVYGYGDMPWYYDDGPSFGHAGPNADLTRYDPRLDFPRVCKYAASKGVDIHVWLNWAALYKDIDRVFDKFNEWGVKGMMVDFMDRDDQEMILIQEDILRKAAEHKLFIQFHGASKPSGLVRTYPNEFTREGTLNYEVYKWNGWQLGADHDINMPFTRVLAGAADYHLGGFRAVPMSRYNRSYSNPVVTNSRAHMLAMYVILESYLHMVADYPMAYENQPGFDFLCQVPTSWDETVVPMAELNHYEVVARRKGDDWFIGAISDSQARSLELKLDFLPKGQRYEATWYRDASDSQTNPDNIDIVNMNLSSADTITLDLCADGGGAALILRAVQDAPASADAGTPAESGTPAICAHRAAGGLFPENTMAAISYCASESAPRIDYIEFDLRLSSDGVPMLIHDASPARSSDLQDVFGRSDIYVSQLTCAQLRQLNFGAKFTAPDGSMPYAGLKGDDVPEDLRILTFDNMLDFLEAHRGFKYIVECKDKGDHGCHAVDLVCRRLLERHLEDRVIMCSFDQVLLDHIDRNYPTVSRGASSDETRKFVTAALGGKKDFSASYDVVFLPYGASKRTGYINTASHRIIDYAHRHNIAVAYWTVNDVKDMANVRKLGADILITDRPDLYSDSF